MSTKYNQIPILDARMAITNSDCRWRSLFTGQILLGALKILHTCYTMLEATAGVASETCQDSEARVS